MTAKRTAPFPFLFAACTGDSSPRFARATEDGRLNVSSSILRSKSFSSLGWDVGRKLMGLNKAVRNAGGVEVRQIARGDKFQ